MASNTEVQRATINSISGSSLEKSLHWHLSIHSKAKAALDHACYFSVPICFRLPTAAFCGCWENS